MPSATRVPGLTFRYDDTSETVFPWPPWTLTPWNPLSCVEDEVSELLVSWKSRTPMEALFVAVMWSSDAWSELSTVTPWVPACETDTFETEIRVELSG